MKFAYSIFTAFALYEYSVLAAPTSAPIVSTRQECSPDQVLVTFNAAADTFTVCASLDGTQTFLSAGESSPLESVLDNFKPETNGKTDEAAINVDSLSNDSSVCCNFHVDNPDGGIDSIVGAIDTFTFGPPQTVPALFCCRNTDEACLNEDPF